MKKIESISDAVNILIDAVNVAQNKGAYSFEDSTIIGQALKFLKESSKPVENKEKD
jgi:hypothetical protein